MILNTLFKIVPVAPREPFQLALDTPLFELRQGTPPMPPLFKLPKHQAARTPDAAGLRLKPAPRHRITLKIILFANKTIKGLTAPLLRIHPVLTLKTRCSERAVPVSVRHPIGTSYGKEHRQSRRCTSGRSTEPHEPQTPPDNDRSQLPLQRRYRLPL